MNVIRLRSAAVTASLVLATASATAQEKPTPPTIGSIERNDPRFDRLVPRDAVIEKLADGFDWSEGPVWDKRRGFLLFSDVPQNTVFRWKEGERRQRLPQAERVHRHRPPRRRARLERPEHRTARAA